MYRRVALLLVVFSVAALFAAPTKKKKKGVASEDEGYILPPIVDESKSKKKKKAEEETQVLPLPKELPTVVTGEVQHLTFVVSPLSGRGLLSAQVRDALKAILEKNRGGTVLKLRAFVAGSGDLRRVGTIVSETFTERKLPLPVLTTVQVGSLPLENAQVVIEAISSDKKVQNENGLAFVSAQPANTQDPIGPLQKALNVAGIQAADVRRVTCFLNTYEKLGDVRQTVVATYPQAVTNFIELQRGTITNFVDCEAVAALSNAPPQPLAFAGVEPGNESIAALVGPVKVALTGEQLGFHQQDADVKLAFDRLGKALEGAGANYKNAAFLHIYSLTRKTSDQIRRIRFDYVDKNNPPAITLLPFEGLPSLDASFAFDLITVIPQ